MGQSLIIIITGSFEINVSILRRSRSLGYRSASSTNTYTPHDRSISADTISTDSGTVEEEGQQEEPEPHLLYSRLAIKAQNEGIL